MHATQSPSLLGRTLSRYRLDSELGVGGTSIVYRAHDLHLQRDVVVKVLKPSVIGQGDARSWLQDEALALSRLNHPNIAVVFDFGTAQDGDFLVMEFVPGITLNEQLGKDLLPLSVAVGLATQLARGLSAAHAARIIHRDIKPSNLRVTPDGRLKILDFGLAQMAPVALEMGSTTTSSGQRLAGTIPYMAPEQLLGERADARTDIYSAGAVLYEMTCGRRVFPETQPARLIDAILNRRPTPPTVLNPQLPSPLERTILKALEKIPARRFPTATALADALETLLLPRRGLASSGFDWSRRLRSWVTTIRHMHTTRQVGKA